MVMLCTDGYVPWDSEVSKVYPDQLYFEKLVDSQSKLSQAGVQRKNMITCENNQLKTDIFVCLQISNVDTGYKKKIANMTP